jgi:hypothetical protein
MSTLDSYKNNLANTLLSEITDENVTAALLNNITQARSFVEVKQFLKEYSNVAGGRTPEIIKAINHCKNDPQLERHISSEKQMDRVLKGIIVSVDKIEEAKKDSIRLFGTGEKKGKEGSEYGKQNLIRLDYQKGKLQNCMKTLIENRYTDPTACKQAMQEAKKHKWYELTGRDILERAAEKLNEVRSSWRKR